MLKHQIKTLTKSCQTWFRNGGGTELCRLIGKVVGSRFILAVILVVLVLNGIALKHRYFGYHSLQGGILGDYWDQRNNRMSRRKVIANRKALLEEVGLPSWKLDQYYVYDCTSWKYEVLIRRFFRKKVLAKVQVSAANWNTDCPTPFPKWLLQANVGSSFRRPIHAESYDVITFDNNDLRALIKNDYPKLLKLYDAVANPDHQVFLWSLCAIHRYGGVVFGPASPTRSTADIEHIQQITGSRHGRCFKMGYVQYDERGQVTLIAASPNHSLLKCVIENLESKTSLEDPNSIWAFFIDHSSMESAMDMEKSQGQNKMLVTSKNTFDACRNTKLSTFSEISSPEDPGSDVLYLEKILKSLLTRLPASKSNTITVNISEKENNAISQRTTHQSLVMASGCEPGWLCDRCIKAPSYGTYAACAPICNKCYIEAICGKQIDQQQKIVIEVDIHVKLPTSTIGQRMIPRIVHQTWFEDISAIRYPQLYRLQNSWRNSGWEYRFYNDTEARTYIMDNYPALFLVAYDTLVPGAFKADLFRYLILLRDGGIYADIDVLLETNLDSLIPPTLSYLAVRDDGIASGHDQAYCLWNGLIAAAPGHPVMARAIERVVNLVSSRADVFDMEREMCQISGKSAEAWKARLCPILTLTGPCALGAATNIALGSSGLLARFDLGWLPFNTRGSEFPLQYGEGLILKTDKSDMEAHRISDVDRNIMVASTDMIDMNKSPLLPPQVIPHLLRSEPPEIKKHYAYLEFVNEVFGSVDVYIDEQVTNEVVKLSLHYSE